MTAPKVETQVRERIEALAKNIQKGLKQKQWTQRVLAEKSGVTVSYVSMLVRGLREPTLEVVFKLGNALDRTFEQMYR